MTNDNHNMNFVFFAVIGTVLVVAVVGVLLWLQNRSSDSFAFDSSRRERLITANADVIDAINKGGCIACHTIPNVPNAIGQVGPNLSNIGVDGSTRREGYSAQEYIRESIKEPGTFTAPECPTGPCPAGVMPQIELEETEIEAIVEYLTMLGVGQ